ncbi:hypothetical protein AMTR_s00014p00089920 [Amborella trichopoda]|uniref:Uncharacterized protein n=1 Tax=Amborella trichopoda TaxID=13333 RepID=W1PGG5_AMBTC|nr:hypothetical protein AMTR_s00014p00089920 [Amborella trichopoda]
MVVIVSSSISNFLLLLFKNLFSTHKSISIPGYESNRGSTSPTIREQLAQLVENEIGEFSLPLGKKLRRSIKTLTTSQKRNIRRQAYLDKVSQRNDTIFFATIAFFVIVPPLLILAVAILTGYVQLLP